MNDLEIPLLIDAGTGEVLKTNQLKPNTVNAIFAQMPDKVLSDYLSQINFVKKIADKLEKIAKEHIKTTRKVEFDEKGKGNFQEWKISKVTTKRFSESELFEKGTQEEIKTYLAIKEKYLVEQEIIKFG